MSVLNAFLATWSNARQTFGAGSPEGGAQFDNSQTLRQLEFNVQSAAPGSRWTGTASSNYETANKDHGRVLGQLAGLDQRVAAEVDRSAQVVATGRRDLDAVRKWVLDCASSVPQIAAGQRQLLPIVSKGLSELTNIVQTSNSELNGIGSRIRGIGGEYQALGNQKFGGPPKKGPGDPDDKKEDNEQSSALTDEEKKEAEEKRKQSIDQGNNLGTVDGTSLADGQLSHEESQRLMNAATLTPEQDAAVDSGNLTIPPERMAYLNGLSHALDGKSPAEIKAILGKLPPSEAQAVSNVLHLVGSDGVHTDVVDPSIKPGEHGYVPSTGGKENLPQSIRDIFDAPLKNSAVPEQVIGPDGKPRMELPDPNKPYKFLDEYRDIAAIANYGDPALQRGSGINDGLLAESREVLDNYDSQGRPNPGLSTEWGHRNVDPALQEMLSAASHDPVAVHDAVAGPDGRSPNNDFIGDLYKHDWADDGVAAGSLFPDTAATSERAGQTMHAFDAYAGQHYQELLNVADPVTGRSGTDSVGQINPELVRALGNANVPYIDDMAGSNLDGTKGFSPFDSGPNANNMRGLFAVIDSDDTAGKSFNAHAANVWKEYVADYSQGLADGGIPQGELLKSVGKLQGAMDMGEYIHQLDSGSDAYEASKAVYAKRGEWFDLAHSVASHTPRLQDAVEVYDSLPGDPLRSMFVGDPPTPDAPTPMPLRDMNEITEMTARYLVHEKAGDIDALIELGYLGPDGELLADMPGAQNAIEQYLSDIGGNNEFPYIKWSDAYQAAIYVSEGEFDPIKPPER